MSKVTLRYDRMVENALRGVVREALTIASQRGLPGAHHFYISFRTAHPGVDIPEFLAAQYPDDMTIVLEHQFWGLEVDEEKFAVTLSFRNQPQRLTIPFAAISNFADPSVKFGLEFSGARENSETAATVQRLSSPPPVISSVRSAATATEETGKVEPTPDSEKAGEIVKLDQFRRK